jgi:glycosyltransferase involved in cell wall biosynthesis
LRRIGYLGSNNLINYESVRSFVTLFRKHQITGRPLTLVIAGGVCDRIRDLAGDGIEIIGRVERLEDFYKSVDLVINPMMFGTGLKIKTVEALSFGAPLVSTRAGMSGITEATHPYHACESVEDLLAGYRSHHAAADRPVRASSGIAQAVCRLLRRHDGAVAKGLSARGSIWTG